VGFILEMKGEFSICKSVNVVHKKKGKNDTIISIEAEKAFEKIFNKNSEQCQYREDIVQHKRTIYDRPTARLKTGSNTEGSNVIVDVMGSPLDWLYLGILIKRDDQKISQ